MANEVDTESGPGEPVPETNSAPASTRRSGWVITLLVLGAVLTLVSTLGTWVERQALDTDAWVDVTDDLLADEEIRGALSVYLVEQLYESVDVEAEIAEALPEDFEGLAGWLAGGLRGVATDAVDRLLSTEQVQTLWSEANRRTHELLIAVIEDDVNEVLSTSGGVVMVDLGEMVTALGERIGLSEDLLSNIPEETGQIVLFESEELEAAQTVARAIRITSFWLFIAVVACFGGAIWLDSVKRRKTVRDVGIAISVVALFVLITRAMGINLLVDSLERAADDEPAYSILDIGSSLLQQVAITELIVGLFLIIFAWLAGPGRVARWVRMALAPVLRYGTASAIVGGLVVFLVLLWLKPGGPIEGWMLGLGIAVLCIVGVAVVQQRTVGEFPDMTYRRFATLAGDAVRGRSAEPEADA